MYLYFIGKMEFITFPHRYLSRPPETFLKQHNIFSHIFKFKTPQLSYVTLFFINNQNFKQSPRKSIICLTISKEFSGVNKRRKLSNPLREQAKTLFLHRKLKRNAHFWTCQFKSVPNICYVSL